MHTPPIESSSTCLKPRAVLTKDQVIHIFRMSIEKSDNKARPSATAVAKQYSVSEKTIRDIWRARTWHDETLPLDMHRHPRKLKKTGRPKGRKDSAPRKRRAGGKGLGCKNDGEEQSAENSESSDGESGGACVMESSIEYDRNINSVWRSADGGKATAVTSALKESAKIMPSIQPTTDSSRDVLQERFFAAESPHDFFTKEMRLGRAELRQHERILDPILLREYHPQQQATPPPHTWTFPLQSQQPVLQPNLYLPPLAGSSSMITKAYAETGWGNLAWNALPPNSLPPSLLACAAAGLLAQRPTMVPSFLAAGGAPFGLCNARPAAAAGTLAAADTPAALGADGVRPLVPPSPTPPFAAAPDLLQVFLGLRPWPGRR